MQQINGHKISSDKRRGESQTTVMANSPSDHTAIIQHYETPVVIVRAG